MDYFAHGLWSYIIFHKSKKPIYAVLFGLLPDSLSWLIYFFYRLLNGSNGIPLMKEFPEWMNFLYCLSHSLFIAFGVILIATLIKRKLPLVMLAWPIAILMDIFTHTKDFFPTPFLWPFFDWTFSGISWGNS